MGQAVNYFAHSSLVLKWLVLRGVYFKIQTFHRGLMIRNITG